MYSVRIDLQALEETVTRPNLIIVTDDIKRMLGITKDVYTQYDEKDSVTKRKTKQGDVRGDNTFKDDRINIEFEETSEENNDLSLVPVHPDFKPIYVDKEVNASFTPIYHSRTVNIKFRYATKSKSFGYSLINRLRLLTSNDGMIKYHDLEYHFTVPQFLVSLMVHINKLKNIRRLTKEEQVLFEDYFKATMDERVDLSTSLDGNVYNLHFLVKERQSNVIGRITDDLHNIQLEQDDSFGTFNIEFNYEFVYEKPVAILAKYPMMVYNTLIDKAFVSFIKETKYNKKGDRTHRLSAMHDITATDSIFARLGNKTYITIPELDKIKLPEPNYKMTRLFSVVSIVDDIDTTLLFNINDVPKVRFKASVLKFILESEREFVGTEYESLFYIEIFKDDKKDYKNKIILEADGTLRSSLELDFKYTYRVMFNVVSNIDMLSKKAKERFRKYVDSQLRSVHGVDLIKNKHKLSNAQHDFKSRRKFAVEFETDNLIVDYLTLLMINGADIERAIVGSKHFLEVPFKLTATKPTKMAKTSYQYVKTRFEAMLEAK